MSRQPGFDGSLMASLAELREIEEERVEAERAALVAADETRRRDVELAAQRIRDQEARRVQTERDAALALEQARLDVEREIRMRAEVAEASERARQQAVIDQQRMTHEIELRRAEVARKRPTWMLAVTAFAVLACVGSSAFAVDRQQAMNDALAAKGVSDRDRAAAREEAATARKDLEAMKVTLGEIQSRVTVALAEVKKAQDAKDLAANDARLRKIDADIAAAKKRDEDKRLEDWKKKRGEKFVIDEECKKNALSKKCLEK
jgi:colicin import membrane protein